MLKCPSFSLLKTKLEGSDFSDSEFINKHLHQGADMYDGRKPIHEFLALIFVNLNGRTFR
jgi:hypothetical protein